MSILLLSTLASLLIIPEQVVASGPAAFPLGSIKGGLAAPVRVALDPSGNIYVTDPPKGSVLVFDSFRRLICQKKGFVKPLSIASDSSHIYVGDEGLGRVSIFDLSWQSSGALGKGDEEFVSPVDIAVDGASGSVFVCDAGANVVKVFQNAVLLSAFGSAGSNPGQFHGPSGIYAAPNHQLYVVDQNNGRVQVFTPTGMWLRSFSLDVPAAPAGFGTTSSSRGQGITGDRDGRIYVADSFQGFISVFDTQGNFLSTVGSFGEGAGQVRSPIGLALDSNNRLFVASANNSRVEIIGLDSYLEVAAEPAQQVIAAGTEATFSVSLAGAGPFVYQWFKDAIPLSEAATVQGTTAPTLRLSSVARSDSGTYSVQVTAPNGTLKSGGAGLTVVAPPSLLLQPAGLSLFQGQDGQLSVSAAGDNLSFQWEKNGTVLTAATTAVLAITAAQASDAGTYRVRISNQVGAILSAPAEVTLIAAPTPPQIDSASILPDNSVELLFRGDAGYSYTIETSADLNTWSSLTTVFSDNGAIEFVDAEAQNYGQRFYRVHWAR